jgi:hypothetical protein
MAKRDFMTDPGSAPILYAIETTIFNVDYLKTFIRQ